jgi:hypothetical protein
LSLSRIIPLLVVAVLAIAGCGGDDEGSSASTDKAKTGEEKKKEEEGGKKKKKDPRSCENLGINVREGKTGTCNQNGNPVTVVNKNTTLDLKEVAVDVGKISSKSSLPGPVGNVTPEKGMTFLIIELSVKNKLTRPAEFNKGFKQVRLRVAGAGFAPNEKGEGAVSNSFFNQNKRIQPQQIQKGTVVFQVKSRVPKSLSQRGADSVILLWNFTNEAGKDPPDGNIRLWK